MRKILFVDDEPRVLEGIENSMFDYADEWEMAFCEGGEAALEELKQEDYDVLVTDMRMPGMSGAELLARARNEHPSMVRFILSGHAETEAALRALPITHQYFSKPCAPEALINAITSACDVNEAIDNEWVRAAVGNIDSLPPRPETYTRLMAAAADENCSLKTLAEIIAGDIAVATKILQIANSAFFSAGRTVSSLDQAVSRLGAGFVSSLAFSVESTASFSLPKSFDVEAVQREAMQVAAVAKAVAPKEIADECFLAGMVHDVGRLALATALSSKVDEIEERIANGEQRCEAEGAVLGSSHAEIGGFLLGLWGMPYQLIEAVTFHHRPEAISKPGPAAYVYLAEALVESVVSGEPPKLDPDFVERMDWDDDIAGWRNEAARILEQSE